MGHVEGDSSPGSGTAEVTSVLVQPAEQCRVRDAGAQKATTYGHIRG
ncbi:hypothetical protein AB0J37_03545 [Microbispora rosea]